MDISIHKDIPGRYRRLKTCTSLRNIFNTKSVSDCPACSYGGDIPFWASYMFIFMLDRIEMFGSIGMTGKVGFWKTAVTLSEQRRDERLEVYLINKKLLQ